MAQFFGSLSLTHQVLSLWGGAIAFYLKVLALVHDYLSDVTNKLSTKLESLFRLFLIDITHQK